MNFSQIVLYYIVILLIACGSDPREELEKRRVPIIPESLIQSAITGDSITVALLLATGMNPDPRDATLLTPLMYASQNGYPSIVGLLMKHGANSSATSKDGWYPLLLACHLQHLDVISLLLSKGVNVDQRRSIGGETCLHRAAERGILPMIDLLIENGADVDAMNLSGTTPLMIAASSNQIQVVSRLLEKGAHVDASNNKGFTAIMATARNNATQSFLKLIEQGGNPNLKNDNEETALSIAVRNGKVAISKLMVTKIIDIDPTDKKGITPLMYAAMYNYDEIIPLLIDAGADVNFTNIHGESVIDFVKSNSRRKGHSKFAMQSRERAEITLTLLRYYGAQE